MYEFYLISPFMLIKKKKMVQTLIKSTNVSFFLIFNSLTLRKFKAYDLIINI